MPETTYKTYGYRWVVLAAYMLVAALNQTLWITFAPITSGSASYYGVSVLAIGVLSLSFMATYLVVSIPASWVIDTYGFHVAVGIGAALTGVFGLMRGLAGTNYTLALLAQIGIAVGQPFILNALTKVSVRWFPIGERATAAGLGSLAIYLGILGGLVLTPWLALHVGIPHMLLSYGVAALVVGVAFPLLARERPATPIGPLEEEERALMFDGLKQALRKKDFILLMTIFFIGLGIFNAVTTWIEEIVRPRGFTVIDAGNAGGLMILGGVIGAVVLPMLSDHFRLRVPFIIVALTGATVGLAGVTFAPSLALLFASSFVLGFFLLSSGPIGFQYGAEIARPAPEGTSTGMLLLMGQVSGIAFILAMDTFKVPATGSMTPSLVVLIALMVVGLVLATQLKESTLLSK
jgi:MFS family permease